MAGYWPSFFFRFYGPRGSKYILTSLAYVSHLDCQSEHMIPFILPTDAASDTLTLGNFIIGSLLSRECYRGKILNFYSRLNTLPLSYRRLDTELRHH